MLSYQDIQAFVYAEARALDEHRWADWLACYADDAEFFMPSWDDDDKLTTDPNNEVSLIYYPTKQGLEDRVFRIQTERSSATMPDTRTGHAINNLDFLVCQDIFINESAKIADVILPACSFAEKDGTFVNHAGLAQGLNWGATPVGECRTDGQVFLDLMERPGLMHAPTIRSELAAEVPYFTPLAGTNLGEYGIQLEGAK